MANRPGKYTKKVQVFVEPYIHDACMLLVDSGVYNSLAELVRDGMDMAIEKANGYEEIRRAEVLSKFSETDMMETRIKIDGTLMRMRVYARWWHLNANTMLLPLIDDLHIPQPLSVIEEKYGTKIELYNMHQVAPTDHDEGYKETYAYKQEHGLLTNEDE